MISYTVRIFGGFIPALAFLTLTFLAQTGTASNKEISEEKLRGAIYAHDFGTVEEALTKTQERFLAGDASADDVRAHYSHFTTTHPKTIEFVKKWLERSPDSVHANTAQAWLHFTAGWNIRGDKVISHTYPDALRSHSDLHRRSWDHARAAYESDPRYIPASDALIRLSISTGKRREALIVLDEVMYSDPNLGTLLRALQMTAPNWGGHWSLAENICETYGPLVEYEIEPVLYCKLRAAFGYHYGSQAKWILQTIRGKGLDALDYMLMPHATSRAATRSEVAFAYEYLNREGVIDVDFAAYFDNHHALEYGYEQQYPKHLSRARAIALEKLEHDPYNQQLLATLLKPVIEEFKGEDGLSYFRTIEESSRQAQLDYVHRQLVSNPYEPDFWRHYIQVNARAENFKTMFDEDPYQINIIAFSNHSPRALSEYARTKRSQLFAMDRTDYDDMHETVREGQKIADTDTDIICPLIRAERLLSAVCQGIEDSYCDELMFTRSMIEATRLDAKERNICNKEVSGPIGELLFEPVDVEPPDQGG